MISRGRTPPSPLPLFLPHAPIPPLCASPPTRGSAIAKIVGRNAAQLAHFDPRVTMWVFEEDIGGRKLTEIINTQHENVKYLPGHKLPHNVVSPYTLQRRGREVEGYFLPKGGHFRCQLDLGSLSRGLLQAQKTPIYSLQATPLGTFWN